MSAAKAGFVLLWILCARGSAQSTWYVNASCGNDSWSGASSDCEAPSGPKKTIQAAMSAALTGDEVVVADGVYRGTGNKWLSFSSDNFTVRSENGPENCVIDLQNSGVAFFLVAAETSQAVVHGFTIENGSNSSGGAFFIHHASQVVISDCTLRNNAASQGGAIYCDTNASPTIQNCRIVDNTATGWGGGLAFSTGGSSPRILGCLIAGNSAGNEGGGVYFSGAGITHAIVNSTIVDNASGGVAGGVFVTSSAGVAITNTIVWGNSGSAIAGPGLADVRFSDVEGGFTGRGNIDDDPMFAGASFRISATSPCIDAGDNALVPPALAFDIAGRPRIADGDGDTVEVVDMGAFERRGRFVRPRAR